MGEGSTVARKVRPRIEKRWRLERPEVIALEAPMEREKHPEGWTPNGEVR